MLQHFNCDVNTIKILDTRNSFQRIFHRAEPSKAELTNLKITKLPVSSNLEPDGRVCCGLSVIVVAGGGSRHQHAGR